MRGQSGGVVTLKVELEKLLEVASGFGTVPMLLSTDENGRPRASAVTVTWDGTVATVRAGHRSLANAEQRPLVSLLWPAPVGERFALLVDGEATASRPDGTEVKSGGWVTVRATSAMLHVVERTPG
jgi:hypothetical protein